MATQDFQTVDVTPTPSSRLGSFFKNPIVVALVLVVVLIVAGGIYMQYSTHTAEDVMQARLDTIRKSEQNTPPLSSEVSQARIKTIQATSTTQDELSTADMNARLQALQASH